MGVLLRSAFVWNCPVRDATNYVEATHITDLDEDDAREILEQFETLDAVRESEDTLSSEYLVTRVVCGPAFVTCWKCTSTHAATLPEMEGDEDE